MAGNKKRNTAPADDSVSRPSSLSSSSFNPPLPESSSVIISQGAEARIWKIPYSYLRDLEAKDKQDKGDNSRKKAKRDDDNDDIEDEEVCHTNIMPRNKFIIAKERFHKCYRHPILDKKLTKQRCRMEARILNKCYYGGSSNKNKSDKGNNGNNERNNNKSLNVPKVLRVDPPILYLEYFDNCITLRERFDNLLKQQHHHTATTDGTAGGGNMSATVTPRDTTTTASDYDNTTTTTTSSLALLLNQYAHEMGIIISKLHYKLGIVHGDLTTSNMMVDVDGNNDDNNNANTNNIKFIDFGLAKNSESAEERAVDLYVLERALLSTHPNLPQPTFWDTVMTAYSSATCNNNNNSDDVEEGTTNTAVAATTTTKTKTMHNNNKSKINATLTRYEQVRQRGRKRECFG